MFLLYDAVQVYVISSPRELIVLIKPRHAAFIVCRMLSQIRMMLWFCQSEYLFINRYLVIPPVNDRSVINTLRKSLKAIFCFYIIWDPI